MQRTSSNSDDPAAVNVTFKLLAVERYFKDQNDVDYAMKSAEYFIDELLNYPNWANTTTNYVSYIHLLSMYNLTNDPEFGKFYKGQATKANMQSEILNFLDKNVTKEKPWQEEVRILYYNGHGDVGDLCLDQQYSYSDLSRDLGSGSNGNNNCTVVILDTCHSGSALCPNLGLLGQSLYKPGRDILCACWGNETAKGWLNNPPARASPGYWATFTGYNSTGYENGTTLPVGIIGAIHIPVRTLDTNWDGWLEANEIFNYANYSTIQYQHLEGSEQHPTEYYGVISGSIPIVQYWSGCPFPGNGIVMDFHANLPVSWPRYGNDVSGTRTYSGTGPTSSNTLYSESLGPNPIVSSPAVADGMTFVTTRDSTSSGTIYALDMADGTIVWQYSLPAPVSSSPDVANGVVYFGTEAPDSTMYAINEYTGELRWSMPLGGGGGGGGIISSPAVADNLVFVGTLDGYFYCLNATTGVQVWNWTTAGPIVSSPAVADGRVFFAAGLIMYAREEIFGGSNWTSTLDSPIVSSPAVADGLVFIGTTGGGGGGGRLYALRETDGSTLWCDLESGNVSSSPAVDSLNGWVIVGAGTNVTCVSETSGSPIWPPYVTLGQIGLSSPAIASNGLVYICSHDQHVYCINETTGLQVWNFAVGVASDSSPAICGGHVYLTPGTGVYCFGLPWPDISVLSLLPGPLYASGGFLYAPINCTVKNKGGFDETFSVECYVEGVSSDPQVYEAPSKVVLSQTLTLTPGQQTTTTGVWNVSDSGDPSDNLLWASVNPVVCEVNTNDNYLIYGTIHIGGEPGGGGSERIPYLQ